MVRSWAGLLAAAVALTTITACSGTEPLAPVAEPATTAPAATSTEAAPTPTAEPVVRCTAADLGLRVGGRGPDVNPGQKTVALVYTNISSRPCYVTGVPGVDLLGPADPNGPTYPVPRPGADAVQPRTTLGPGRKASATLTYLSGGAGWVPTEIITTPPGDTHQLVTRWSLGDPVLRQDGATHPGTFVGPLVAS
ncbi:MAG: DUF4232 domain-containing protein [Pseudonocardia sp.]|jgi:hypothetical protein|uniref:DUF4232 domain-containing protein n=1 Tax=Pseudonocardia sp. TaxID=60912 RepID=UPI00095FFC61|nr:DUF4232 domain-containing protein [Pseudonocardia sp.]MBN9102560.1 DUF4232 domain-containing protein [Pseudonocardia sp.]OJY46832.1 MAG: hypothetical protein BGP03_27285 [Pseudonocardia sp. 73-21]